MPIHHFESYRLAGPKGSVILSRNHQVGMPVPHFWSAQSDVLGSWIFEITEDSDALREAKYLSPLTGLPADELFTFLTTHA